MNTEKEFTQAELDIIFKDDPVYQEVQRKLASMRVRDLLGSSSAHTYTPATSAAPAQRDLYEQARAQVRRLLHPEEYRSENQQQPAAVAVSAAAQRQDQTAISSPTVQEAQTRRHVHQQASSIYTASRYSSEPHLGRKPVAGDTVVFTD